MKIQKDIGCLISKKKEKSSRDVIFLENKFSVDSKDETDKNIIHIKLSEEEEAEDFPDDGSTQSNNTKDNSEEEEFESLTETEKETPDKPVAKIEDRRNPKRNRNNKEYPDYILYQMTYESNDPKTFEEAMKREDSTRWKDAIEAKLQSMAIKLGL